MCSLAILPLTPICRGASVAPVTLPVSELMHLERTRLISDGTVTGRMSVFSLLFYSSLIAPVARYILTLSGRDSVRSPLQRIWMISVKPAEQRNLM